MDRSTFVLLIMFLTSLVISSASSSETIQSSSGVFHSLLNAAKCDSDRLVALKQNNQNSRYITQIDTRINTCMLATNVSLRPLSQIQNPSNSSSSDVTAPELLEIELSTYSVDVTNGNQTIIITAKAYDAESPIDYLLVRLDPPPNISLNHSKTVFISNWSNTAEQGEQVATDSITFDKGDFPGTWTMYVNGLQDENFNYRELDLDSFELNALGIQSELELTNPYEVDLTPPSLVDFELSTNEIDLTNGNQSITMTLTFFEEGSDMDSAYAVIDSPEGVPSSRQKNLYFSPSSWRIGNKPNTYQATTTIDFDSQDPPGEWRARVSQVSDSNRNFSLNESTNSELVNAGFIPNITITNPSQIDTTPPELRNLEISKNLIDTTTGRKIVEFVVTVFDEDSRPGYANINILPPSSTSRTEYLYINSMEWTAQGDQGLYTGRTRHVFNAGSESGVWTVNVQNLSDALNNRLQQSITHTDLLALGVDPFIRVDITDDEIPDLSILAPKQTAAKIGDTISTAFAATMSNSANVPTNFTFDFNLADGLSFASFSVVGPASTSQTCSITSSRGSCEVSTSDWSDLSFVVSSKIKASGEYSVDATLVSDVQEVRYANNTISSVIKAPNFPATQGDFDGNGSADLSFRHQSIAEFYNKQLGLTGYSLQVFGRQNDIPVTGDFDGDGIVDLTVWRRADLSWYIKQSSNKTVRKYTFGNSVNDIPVPADYDGDGVTDFALWSPQTGEWSIMRSQDETLYTKRFGRQSTDIPVPADYDGDGKADIAIRRPTNGTWYIVQSQSNSVVTARFGTKSTDIPVPADYDGDGKADVAVRRPSTGRWYILQSTNDAIRTVSFGIQATDVPVVSDYDNDGIADIAIQRPTNHVWYVLYSSNNQIMRQGFGNYDYQVPLLAPVKTRIGIIDGELIDSSVTTNLDNDAEQQKMMFEDTASFWSQEFLGKTEDLIQTH